MSELDCDVSQPYLDPNDSFFLIRNKNHIHYKPLPQLEKLKVGEYMAVRISQVSSPYRFWFHLDENVKPLGKFMRRINKFYDGQNNYDLEMAMEQLKVNRLCAARYKGKWHRAVIVNLDKVKDDKIKVHYVDYGTVDFVSISEIQFLHEFFAKMPIQTYRGCLEGIIPSNATEWDFEANQHFWDITKCQTLYAAITDVDTVKQIYYMHLFEDVEQLKIPDIGEKLIFEYFAKRSKIYDQKIWLSESLPSFDSLEIGKAKSYKEMELEHKTLLGLNKLGLL